MPGRVEGRTGPPKVNELPNGALFPGDVADRLGIQRRTVHHYAQVSQRRHEDGETLGPADFPLPDGVTKRAIRTGAVWTPFWLPETVERYALHRRGRGNPGKPQPAEQPS